MRAVVLCLAAAPPFYFPSPPPPPPPFPHLSLSRSQIELAKQNNLLAAKLKEAVDSLLATQQQSEAARHRYHELDKRNTELEAKNDKLNKLCSSLLAKKADPAPAPAAAAGPVEGPRPEA